MFYCTESKVTINTLHNVGHFSTSAAVKVTSCLVFFLPLKMCSDLIMLVITRLIYTADGCIDTYMIGRLHALLIITQNSTLNVQVTRDAFTRGDCVIYYKMF